MKLRTIVIASLAWLLLSSATGGQCAPGASCCPTPGYAGRVVPGPRGEVRRHAAVVRIRAGQDIGSGVIVECRGNSAWVATAAHVIESRPVIVEAGSRKYATQIEVCDEANDVALLRIARPPGLPAVEISQRPPRPGEPLRLLGFAGRDYRASAGKALGYVMAGGQTTRNTLVMSGRGISGQSGGPMLDSSGRLVGIMWGSREGRCYGTVCTRLRRLFRGIFGRVAAPLRPLPALPATPPIATPADSGGDSMHAAEFDRLRQKCQALAGQVDGLQKQVHQQGTKIAGLQAKIAQLENTLAALGAKKISFQLLDQQGEIKDEYRAGLGETVRFQLVPIGEK